MDRDRRLTGRLRGQTDGAEAPAGFELSNGWRVCFGRPCANCRQLIRTTDGNEVLVNQADRYLAATPSTHDRNYRPNCTYVSGRQPSKPQRIGGVQSLDGTGEPIQIYKPLLTTDAHSRACSDVYWRMSQVCHGSELIVLHYTVIDGFILIFRLDSCSDPRQACKLDTRPDWTCNHI